MELVAERRLELGIVGAAPRHRAVRFEPFTHDEVVLVCPPRHRFAGRTVDVHELAAEALVVMQEGAGVRRIVEDELRRLGVRLRDLDPPLELGLQESVRSAVLAGYGVTFISRAAVESDLDVRRARRSARRRDGRPAGDLARRGAPPGRSRAWPTGSSTSRAERIATLGGLGLVPAAAGE